MAGLGRVLFVCLFLLFCFVVFGGFFVGFLGELLLVGFGGYFGEFWGLVCFVGGFVSFFFFIVFLGFGGGEGCLVWVFMFWTYLEIHNSIKMETIKERRNCWQKQKEVGSRAGGRGLPGKFAFLTEPSFPAASSTKGKDPGLRVLAAALGQKCSLQAAK